MAGPPDDQPLGFLLSRAATALRADVTATVLHPPGVAFPTYLCMRIVSQYPGRSNAELAGDFNVSPQAMTQAMNTVVRVLEQRGLVTRRLSWPGVNSARLRR